MKTASPFATVEDAIADIKAGRMVVVCDDEDRENEGDLTIAAEFATPEVINFMSREGRGLICLAMETTRCDELGLDLMTMHNESGFGTAFTLSIEAREGIKSGISAADRSHTIRVAVDATDDGVRLRLRTALAGESGEGDSVAVNGVWLTAVGMCGGELFGADVMHETLRRSSLAELSAGGPVNLEMPLRASDRLGGHVVQGHVDGVAVVRETREDGFARVVTFDAPAELLRYVVEKGSIAVDGVSLTVSAIDDTSFSVSLIPETLERTTLGTAEPGRPVNLEVDVLAKYVEKLVRV